MTRSQGEMQETYPVPGEGCRYQLEEQDGRLTFRLEGAEEGQEAAIVLDIESRETGEGICRTESGKTLPFAWAWVGSELHLWLSGDLYIYRRAESRRRSRGHGADASGDILAPMPGAVLEVLVSEGDQVERNQTVVVMESMKMELLIAAPCDGVISRVSVQAGQQVERGMRLLEIAPIPAQAGIQHGS